MADSGNGPFCYSIRFDGRLTAELLPLERRFASLELSLEPLLPVA